MSIVVSSSNSGVLTTLCFFAEFLWCALDDGLSSVNNTKVIHNTLTSAHQTLCFCGTHNFDSELSKYQRDMISEELKEGLLMDDAVSVLYGRYILHKLLGYH